MCGVEISSTNSWLQYWIKWVVCFTFRPLYPKEQRPWYPLQRLVGALGQGWLIGGKKNFLSSPKIEPQFVSRPARNQVSAPCELIRLPSLSMRDHVPQPYKTLQLHPWTRSYYEITVLVRFRRSSEQRRKLWMLVELSAWWVRPPARRTWQTTGKVSGNHPHTAHDCADTVRIKFMHNVRTSSTIWNSYSSTTRQQSSRCVKQP